MILLQENMTNTVKIDVNASIDIQGFSLVLAACGVLKTISDITQKNLRVEYSAAEVLKTRRTGTYGTLIVYDGDGKEYITYTPLFKRIAQGSSDVLLGKQTIYITLASTREASSGSSGGDTPSPSPGGDYVTPEQLNQAINAVTQSSKNYTDEAIEGIETTIIEEQPVHVVDEEGQPINITVKAAVQQMVNNTTNLDTKLTGEIKDDDHDGQPDNETLYLYGGIENG